MGCDFLLGIYSIYQKAYIFITNFIIPACCNTGKTVKSMQIYAVEGIAHVGAGAELFINVSFVTTFDSAQGILKSLRGQYKPLHSFRM